MDVNSENYLRDLRSYRDRALEESDLPDSRRTLGNFVYGIAQASWESEAGGLANLVEKGIRYKRTPLTKSLPTTLRLVEAGLGRDIKVAIYTMDLDDVGYIAVSHWMTKARTLWEADIIASRKRINPLMLKPTNSQQDRELLYTELSRGASGCFPYDYSRSANDFEE